MADINTDQMYQGVTLEITDSKGRPAAVEGAPVWASSDETVLTVTASADGMSADINTVAPGGPARVSVTADADLGAGVTQIVGFSEDINVTQGPSSVASTLKITLPAATDKP